MGPQADQVLDLEARRRIVEFVRENPGMHLRALADALGMPVSTLEYHCYHLVRHEHLATRDTGGFKAFFPAEGLDRRDKDILYVVRHEAPRRICSHLLLHPGTTPGDLKAVTQLAAPTLSFHLKKLRNAGLLREEPDGRTKRLYIEDAERVANVLVTYRKSFVDDAVDRFTEAWMALGVPTRRKADATPDGATAEAPAAAELPALGQDHVPLPATAPAEVVVPEGAAQPPGAVAPQAAGTPVAFTRVAKAKGEAAGRAPPPGGAPKKALFARKRGSVAARPEQGDGGDGDAAQADEDADEDARLRKLRQA